MGVNLQRTSYILTKGNFYYCTCVLHSIEPLFLTCDHDKSQIEPNLIRNYMGCTTVVLNKLTKLFSCVHLTVILKCDKSLYTQEQGSALGDHNT